MRRRELLKGALIGGVFLSGCSSGTDQKTPTPDHPEVGELYIQEFQPDEPWGNPIWDLVVKLDDEYTEGTLKLFYMYGNDDIIDRVNIQRKGPVLRFPYLREDGPERLPRSGYGYIARVEIDNEIVAESRFKVDRNISVGQAQFESRVGGGHKFDLQVLEYGKASFSVRIENTGNVPLKFYTVKDGSADFGLSDPLIDGDNYILAPGDSNRYGVFGYILPELEKVDEVCDGSKRTTTINIETRGDSWEYELSYSLSEPASKTGITVNPAVDDPHELYVCETGEIFELSEVNSD